MFNFGNGHRDKEKPKAAIPDCNIFFQISVVSGADFAATLE